MLNRFSLPKEGPLSEVGEEGYPSQPSKHRGLKRVISKTSGQEVLFLLSLTSTYFKFQSFSSFLFLFKSLCSRRGMGNLRGLQISSFIIIYGTWYN